MSFIILALPRSRTAWLAHFLATEGQYQVGHDLAVHCDSIADFVEGLSSGRLSGTVETGAVLGWQLLRSRLPETRLVTVHRPRSEVVASLAKFGIGGAEIEAELAVREGMLEVCAVSPGVEALDWKDLDRLDCCQWLYHHCHGTELPLAWFEKMRHLNIQINMLERSRLLFSRQKEMAGLREEVLSAVAVLPKEFRAWMH